MAVKKTSEGVGKKIVEALKKQSAPVIEEEIETQNLQDTDFDEIAEEESFEADEELDNISEQKEIHVDNVLNFGAEQQQNMVETPLDTGFLNNVSFENMDSQPTYQKPEIKTDNVKILSNLINQLPPGISKQTGAQIIKQTMEALGISMKTVLGEAQQIQEKISTSSNECLASIQDYKKQIQIMEKQVQQYHKQYNALNELISLFVQTGI